jgi:phosphate transport system protein
MGASRDEREHAAGRSGQAAPSSTRHTLREQEAVWIDFLAMARAVVDSLAKSVEVLCEGRLEVVKEVKSAEKQSDREEVRIEQECLRILALYEPVASDLRRLATILKVNRDWERIADLAARIARRARKLARKSEGILCPELLKVMGREVLGQVRAAYEALTVRDSRHARAVIDGDAAIDRQYHRVRKELKEKIRQDAAQFNTWLPLLSTARNLERIADHAKDIAETLVYLQEGTIIRHHKGTPPASS